MNGGPSPRIRALASQERLTLSIRAASAAVSRTIAAGAVAFGCTRPRPISDCETTSFPFLVALVRNSDRHKPKVGKAQPRVTSTKGVYCARGFCRFTRARRFLLRSRRLPHASALGERMNLRRKGSSAWAASNSHPVRALVFRSLPSVGSTPVLAAISSSSAVNSSYQS